jgi:hypothetical protein
MSCVGRELEAAERLASYGFAPATEHAASGRWKGRIMNAMMQRGGEPEQQKARGAVKK